MQPAPPKARWPHALSCGLLGSTEKLPVHGILIHVWGLGGESVITVDRDAKRFSYVSQGTKPGSRTRAIDDATLRSLVGLAEAAGNEVPAGKPAHWTDIREDLYYVDGADCFYLTGGPLTTGDSPTDRPAAARLMAAVYHATLHK